jgi:hypothetical protein
MTSFDAKFYCSSWPGFVPAIHVFCLGVMKDVDTRDIGAKRRFVASRGHDDICATQALTQQYRC